MILLSRICFWCLALLALIYAGQLAHATIIAAMTDPPACKIVTTTVLPSPLCPGLAWEQHTRFLLSLPGAYLSYPIEIGLNAGDRAILRNPLFIVIMLVHVFGWSYLATKIAQLVLRRNRTD